MCYHDELDHELELTQARHEKQNRTNKTVGQFTNINLTPLYSTFDTQQKDSTHHPSLCFFCIFPIVCFIWLPEVQNITQLTVPVHIRSIGAINRSLNNRHQYSRRSRTAPYPTQNREI